MHTHEETAEKATTAPASLAAQQNILGEDVVFLPIPKGEKGPRLKNWPEFELSYMQNPRYLAKFEEHTNIGVLLGHPSAHLIGFDFDNEDALQSFLELNPDLRGTATVVGAKGAKLFVRADRVPQSGKIRDEDGNDVGDLLADDSQAVIYGTHPDGMDYRWTCETQPIEVCLDDIVLPEGWTAPWVLSPAQKAAKLYGRPYAQGKTVYVGSLKESFWAGLLYLSEILLYESKEAQFYRYEELTGLWSSMTEDSVKRRIARLIYDYANSLECGVTAEQIRHKVTDSFLRACVGRLRSIAEKVDAFETKFPHLIHVKNGMFDLDTSELLPFGPEYYSRNQIPIAYVPTADCPRFIEELLGGMLGAEDQSLLQRVIGGFLLPENLPQVIVMIYGEAKAGKSTLANVCAGIIGQENIGGLRLRHVDSRFEIGRLIGARVLSAPDIPSNFLGDGNAQSLKAMTGGDYLDAELKGSNNLFKVPGVFHILITGNSRPIIDIQNDRDAWKRRLVPFKIERLKEPQSIPNFAKMLIDKEGPGILRWAIEGAQLLREEMETFGKLQLTKSQETRINDLLYESDSLRHFLEYYVTVEKTGHATTEQIQRAYAEFCREKKWTPIKDSIFRAKLPDLMQEIHYVSPSHNIPSSDGDQRGYRNIRIHSLQGGLFE
ncbi:MAG: hypothetical protein GVY36_17320 [Verrucomicrobia bacterium]|jgi:P4 family phage/plasmid primase-like protien|nr:hypothetical protein [Verrucomicrobiota bacterium]